MTAGWTTGGAVRAALFLLMAAGCARGPGGSAPRPVRGPLARPTAAEPTGPPTPVQPVAPPLLAHQIGLMPLASTGIPEWLAAHPSWDGRGVLIAILDSGADLGVLGLQTTTLMQRKVLDLRELSGEGDVALVRVRETRGLIVIDSATALGGAASVRAIADDSLWYGGVLRELPFGEAPAADFNANGSTRDRYGIVVVKRGGRWVALIDSNGDGSLSDEAPLADYLVRNETFTFSSRYVPRGRGPITGAVNLAEQDGVPSLSIFLDTSGHGTHVSGIASGHDMYGVAGFNGVAPGAQLMVVKIANNARGGVTTNGSMIRAMEYAARFAEERHLPMVMNMSFGIGNEQEGAAVMDSIVDAFLLAHPSVAFSIAAGNDGPGLSTLGLPGSAELALTAGASYPGVFAQPQFGGPSSDVMGWWSSRGGELAKPDVVVPGMAYSTVPRWNTGDEIKLGTSMAAPYLTGMTALLLSASLQEHQAVRGADLAAALRVTAVPMDGARPVDEGAGLARIDRAWRWLAAGHRADLYRVEALAPREVMPGMQPGAARETGNVAPARPARRRSAFYRRGGLLPGDSVARFRVAFVPPDGAAPPARRFRLASDAAWLRPVRDTVSLDQRLGTALVDARIDRAALRRPGRYVAAITGTVADDSAAGAAFRLWASVIVPDTAGGIMTQPARKLSGGATSRSYVDVPAGASGLAVRATLRGDTTTPAVLFLFEPGGRPARGESEDDLGGQHGGRRSSLLADAADVQPGVYEIVMQAMPGHEVNYDLDVAVPPVRVAAVDSGAAPSVTFAATADTTVEVTARQLGISTSWEAVLDSGRTWTRSVAVPSWATSVVVETQLQADTWNEITDFAVSVFDGSGARLGGAAMNYAFERGSVDLPERRAADYRVTIELFPGFARPVPPERFPARVRVFFKGDPRPLGAALSLHVTPRAAATYRVPAFSPLAAAGWSDWIEVRAAARPDDWASVVRAFSVPRP